MNYAILTHTSYPTSTTNHALEHMFHAVCPAPTHKTTREKRLPLQKLSSRRKLGLLAEPQLVHAPPCTPCPIPPPLLHSCSPAAAALSRFTPTPTGVSRSPYHPLADLHSGRRVLEGEAPRDVAEVKGADLEHRSAVGSACRVGPDVALEGRTCAVQERLVSGHEELEPLLELIRQLELLEKG